MRILLINPPFTKIYNFSGQGGKTAPLNIAYIAAYARKYSNSLTAIEILDAESLEYDFDMIHNKITNYAPDIVAVTMTTPAYNSAKKIITMTKEINKNIVTVVGGAHPSAFPKELLDEIPQIDFSIIGEGEKPFAYLLDAISNGWSFAEIKGLAYRNDGKIIFNHEIEYIRDIDMIPFPARDLLPMSLYEPSTAKDITHKGGFSNIFTSRGCPYDCVYCSSRNIWSGKVRIRSAMNVVNEIEECYKTFNITKFNFNDDIFPISRQRTIDICNEIISKDMKIHWTCMTRVNYVWEDAMIKMKDAGCEIVNFGFESGSDEILKSINKKTTVKQGIEAVKICKKAKLKVMGNFMIGNIGETEDTIKESIRYSKTLGLDSAAFFIAMPYPGTKLYTMANDLGYLRKDWSYTDLLAYGNNNPPLILPNLPPETLHYWQKKAMKEFYLRPNYILNKIKGIRSTRDILSLLRAFMVFIKIVIPKVL
ncbi:B12-binding domain-containing radical SAM protein [Candidatus Magnetominusculus xianensis]|uniref:Radical SAM protein n=1 Tax=Candidatus Magnetominusculus xianensis TaxID=1748249 RepID=A0ABR5SHX5_9BACT|nr:radical SAM protein [Candidatus Magnetominusculus xianensis]KWT90137.1 radical SAM protein [Candidatus Magnetominusculus xianensis]MBF0403631.1 cobalamin-dependent protein [Nitrospirota bacterium]